MFAVDFPEKTTDLKAPSGMEDDCSSAAVHIIPYDESNPELKDVMIFTTKWRFSNEQEKEEFLRTGDLWVTTVCTGLPPMNVCGISPFKEG